MVLLFIAPLIFVLIKIDKNKIFLIGFYGYSIHMTLGYLDMVGRNLGFWNFPFPLIPGITRIGIGFQYRACDLYDGVSMDVKTQ